MIITEKHPWTMHLYFLSLPLCVCTMEVALCLPWGLWWRFYYVYKAPNIVPGTQHVLIHITSASPFPFLAENGCLGPSTSCTRARSSLKPNLILVQLSPWPHLCQGVAGSRVPGHWAELVRVEMGRTGSVFKICPRKPGTTHPLQEGTTNCVINNT